jgi:hypothetical protein
MESHAYAAYFELCGAARLRALSLCEICACITMNSLCESRERALCGGQINLSAIKERAQRISAMCVEAAAASEIKSCVQFNSWPSAHFIFTV